MNKQDLINEINKVKANLANMEKMLAECEYERWKPKEGGTFFFVHWDCSIGENIFNSANPSHMARYNAYNCFQTHEQAEAEAEKILIRRQLEEIASRLNKGKKINWKSTQQAKYYLRYNIAQDGLDINLDFNIVHIGITYCLSNEFLNVAIREIGKERLKKYLRGE